MTEATLARYVQDLLPHLDDLYRELGDSDFSSLEQDAALAKARDILRALAGEHSWPRDVLETHMYVLSFDDPNDDGIYQWVCSSVQPLTHNEVCYLWASDPEHHWFGRGTRQSYDWLQEQKWAVWEGYVEPFLTDRPRNVKFPQYTRREVA